MAIISGVMQMAGTGEQIDDVGDARTALSSLLGVSESVRPITEILHTFCQGYLLHMEGMVS